MRLEPIRKSDATLRTRGGTGVGPVDGGVGFRRPWSCEPWCDGHLPQHGRPSYVRRGSGRPRWCHPSEGVVSKPTQSSLPRGSPPLVIVLTFTYGSTQFRIVPTNHVGVSSCRLRHPTIFPPAAHPIERGRCPGWTTERRRLARRPSRIGRSTHSGPALRCHGNPASGSCANPRAGARMCLKALQWARSHPYSGNARERATW